MVEETMVIKFRTTDNAKRTGKNSFPTSFMKMQKLKRIMEFTPMSKPKTNSWEVHSFIKNLNDII